MSNQEEFDSLYQSAKYAKFGLDDDYIGDSTVKSEVVIAMYDELTILRTENAALKQRMEEAEKQLKNSVL